MEGLGDEEELEEEVQVHGEVAPLFYSCWLNKLCSVQYFSHSIVFTSGRS